MYFWHLDDHVHQRSDSAHYVFESLSIKARLLAVWELFEDVAGNTGEAVD